MFLFGHTGLTLGAFWLGHRLLGGRAGPESPARPHPSIDYRIVFISGIVPDMIDKPLGLWLWRETFNTGWLFAHTAAFTLALLVLGLVLYLRRGNPALLVLSYGSAMHLAQDEMWRDLPTLVWPLYGWGFPHKSLPGWSAWQLSLLSGGPLFYAGEIAGLIILGTFFVWLRHRGKIGTFIRRGAT